MIAARLNRVWIKFWMKYAGASGLRRIATRIASSFTPPFYGRQHLAKFSKNGYISPSATIYHSDIRLNSGVFIDDRVLIYADEDGGHVELSRGVLIYRDTVIQTGAGGSVTIGAYSSLQPRCQLSAYKGSIEIGKGVMIAPNCCFYPYDHGFASGALIRKQPLETKGDIVIADDAWIGVGVIVLQNVRIGQGGVIAAGSVVTRDIPDNAIAGGIPARVVKMRGN